MLTCTCTCALRMHACGARVLTMHACGACTCTMGAGARPCMLMIDIMTRVSSIEIRTSTRSSSIEICMRMRMQSSIASRVEILRSQISSSPGVLWTPRSGGPLARASGLGLGSSVAPPLALWAHPRGACRRAWRWYTSRSDSSAHSGTSHCPWGAELASRTPLVERVRIHEHRRRTKY